MVPDWLVGTWIRTYIRRRLKHIPPPHNTSKDPSTTIETDHLDQPDHTIQVRYIQTPFVFLDVRSKIDSLLHESKEHPMAFAGVTTVTNQTNIPLVQWHSCMDLDEDDMDCLERWNEAEMNAPRNTNDVGYFQCVSSEAHVFHEYDPDRTLLEQWVRVDDGNGKFLAIRSVCGQVLLVVAGKYFGYADQKEGVFVSGIVEDCDYQIGDKWIIETSAADAFIVGQALQVHNRDWVVLRGSSLALETVDSILIKS